MFESPQACRCGDFSFFDVKSIYNMEIKGKKNTEFRIRQEDQEYVAYFGYLPHFAVVGKNTILIPEDGYINIYYNMQPAGRFDCSMCTRDSKLYSTLSGILLLENNTLYLLNTK